MGTDTAHHVGDHRVRPVYRDGVNPTREAILMHDPYRNLLRSLLPLVLTGCGDGDTGEGEATESTGCITVADDATECPAAEDVDVSSVTTVHCGTEAVSVEGEGSFGSSPTGWGDTGTVWCCYPIIEAGDADCDYGRPFIEGGQPRFAESTKGAGWAAGPTPATDMPAEARALLAEAWKKAALDEHAAVAAFSRLALELMAFGAPAALVARTNKAAAEEIVHAQMGFQLASAYAGHPVRPDAFPLGEQLSLTRDLAAFAAATAREGCIGETLITLVVLESLRHTTDPAARATLERITSDEIGHAQLAWATVRWAIDVGGPEVHGAVAQVFAELAASGGHVLPQRRASGPYRDHLVAHGLPDAAMARRALDRGVAEVVMPAARALLAGDEAMPLGRASV